MSFYILHRNSRWPKKWRKNDFWENLPVDSADKYHGGRKFHRNCSISHHFGDKCVFAFYAEIQDGRQKWQENNISQNLPEDCADTLLVKTFVEIALSHTVSEILKIFHFQHKEKSCCLVYR